MEEPIKVLHVTWGMGTGGAEKDIMNWYRTIDRSKYSFDFLIRSDNRFYEKKINDLGGRLYTVSEYPRYFIKNYFETYTFLRNNTYDVIHTHGNALIYIVPLIIARRLHIKKRIMHIHSTSANGKVATLIHKFNKCIIKKYATDFVACSDEAGKFAFGTGYEVIHNGVFWEDYRNIYEKRFVKRKELNIPEDSIIFGSVARFLPVKNHSFIIDVFEEVSKLEKNAYLLLVGSGPLKENIMDYVKQKNLQTKVRFLGDRDDVNEILAAMDMLIFPSLYEGVPLVPIEAQAARTKVICSDLITDDIMITKYIRKKALEETSEQWAKECIQFLGETVDDDVYAKLYEKGYCMDSIIENLSCIYRRKIL